MYKHKTLLIIAYSGKEIVIWYIAMAWLHISAYFNLLYSRRVQGTDAVLTQTQKKTFHCLQWKLDGGLDSKIRGWTFSPKVKRQSEL